MATPFNFDFSKLNIPNVDFSKLPTFELPNIDLSAIDLDALTKAAKDVAYITVGLGVLAVQKVQLRRNEFVKAMNEQFESGKAQFDEASSRFASSGFASSGFEGQLAAFDARLSAIEAKIDEAVEGLEKRLPDPAGALLAQAHEATKAARKQVRELLNTRAA